MLILDYKLRGNQSQQSAIDEAIRLVQFIRNKALRLWTDGRGISQYDMQALCDHLAQAYPCAARLNSMARQASADRAWQALAASTRTAASRNLAKMGIQDSRKTTLASSTR